MSRLQGAPDGASRSEGAPNGASRFGERVAEGFRNVFEGKLVWSGRSAYQKIDVYEHPHFGRVLTLDDLVQTTERDEFCYHELLVHPALTARDRIGTVLVIGGGDGGTLRHILQHDPSEAVMCEIDEEVVRVSRELLPSLSSGAFDDPRSRVVIGDGAAFVAEHEDAFDAILVDSTDPIGAAEVLFSSDFYAACRRALRPGGVLVSQTGTPLYQLDELQAARTDMAEWFPVVETYLGFVPAYPGVLWSFTAATDGPPLSAAPPAALRERLEARGIRTCYYTPEVHAASFTLPAFFKELDAAPAPASVPGG